MSCRRYRRRLALLAGGDLGSREASRVRKHLEGCEACRSLLDELASSRARLVSLASAMSGEEDESALGDRVVDAWRRERVGDQREVVKPTLLRIFASPARAAAMATALLLAVLAGSWIMLGPRTTISRSARSMRATRAKARTQPSRPEASPSLSRAAAPTNDEAQVTKFTVKLETGDPKVVIYWVVETKKGATSS